MTEKELRKLSRRELLELLIIQTKKADRLKQQLDEANRKLNDRTVIIENSGSLAEAVMKLNGVFEAAQNAAQQYLDNLQYTQQSGQQNGREESDEQIHPEIQ